MADWEGTVEDRRNSVTRGLTGLPVGNTRARELGELIASGLELAALEPLVELLPGIAPHWTNGNEMPEGWSSLSGDLWARYTSAIDAIETLCTYSPEFRKRVEAYMLRLRPTVDTDEEIRLTKNNKIKKDKRK